MKIGEVATRADVSVATVRYYERRGLLKEPPRSSTGYRNFGSEAADRIRFIKQAQRLGFTLEEIKELLALRVERHLACDPVKQQAEAKIADIATRVRELTRMKHVLETLVASCESHRPTSDCPILEVLEKEEHA